MTRFDIPIDTKKRKKDVLMLVLYIAFFVFMLTIFAGFTYENDNYIRRIIPVFFLVTIGFSIYERWKKLKQKPFFLEIGAEEITWFTDTTAAPENVRWDEVRWIKNDLNKSSIMISRQSSFGIGFLWRSFPVEQQQEIKQLLVRYGNERNIQMINFSPALS